MKISIIVPAYNEAKNIGKALDQIIGHMGTLDLDYEVLVVNDGSQDETSLIVKKAAFKHQNIKLINNPSNKGKGYSIRNGLLKAKGDYMLFLDADMATPISEIDKMLPLLKDYDLLLGSRRIKGSQIIAKQSLLRRIAGKTFFYLVSSLILKGISDTQCGFKMYKANVARKLAHLQTMDGWAFDVEHLFLASKFNLKVKEIPVIWIDDEDSRLKVVSASLQMLKDIFSIRLNNFFKRYD